MNYSIKERILTFTGPKSLRPAAAFSVEGFTDAECAVLKSSVQRHLDVLNQFLGHGPFTIDVGPSASADLATFIVLKTEFAENMREIAVHQGEPTDSWRWELAMIHDIAKSHAETVRNLRSHAADYTTVDASTVPARATSPEPDLSPPESPRPPIRLQVQDEDAGGRFVVFDSTGAQEWGPRIEPGGSPNFDGMYTWMYDDFLYRLPTGHFVRVRHTSHCEANLPFPASIKRFSDAEAAEWLLFGGFDLPKDISSLADAHRFNVEPPPVTEQPMVDHVGDISDIFAVDCRSDASRVPSDVLQATYRDPDNYWRNVWLYQQRKAGRSNQEILAELMRAAAERGFAPLTTDTALRSALETIAIHHGWTVLKGKAGRPRVRPFRQPTASDDSSQHV